MFTVNGCTQILALPITENLTCGFSNHAIDDFTRQTDSYVKLIKRHSLLKIQECKFDHLRLMVRFGHFFK